MLQILLGFSNFKKLICLNTIGMLMIMYRSMLCKLIYILFVTQEISIKEKNLRLNGIFFN